MQFKQFVWMALVLVVRTAAAADEAGSDVKNHGSVDQDQTKQHILSMDPKKDGEPLPWRAEVSPAKAGLPVQINLRVKDVLGTGSLHLEGGDRTSITFLASAYLDQASGSLPVSHVDLEGQKEQIAMRESGISGPGYETRQDSMHWPLNNSQLYEDTNSPMAPSIACPVFVVADEEDVDVSQAPDYDLACKVESGGLVLEVTHVYSDPGQYQVEAHYLDDSLGVVTGRWQAQVQVYELLQVTLGPSQVIPLQDGHAAAFATLSITPPVAPLPLPCLGGLISWAWDFGDSTGAERRECTSEEREKEKEERMIQEGKRGVERDLDFLRDGEKGTENLTELEESGGEGKKEVESTDKREWEGREAEGSREQKKDSPDSFASSLSYYTFGFTPMTPPDKYTSNTPDTLVPILPSSPPHPLTKPRKVTSSILNDHINAVPSLPTPIVTLVTSTERDDDSFTSTTTTTTTPNGAPFATTVTVRHTYSTPGIYNMSVQLLCGCRRVAGKDITAAFTVAEPVGDVQISVSDTHLLLIPSGPEHLPTTQKVVMTVMVASGSFLQPFTLNTGDGNHVLLQPTRNDPAGPWVAQAKHKYHLAGEYQLWVEVGNPVGRRRVVFHTVIKVDQPPDSVRLVPENYMAAVGEEVEFRAEAFSGSPSVSSSLHYDWVLPGEERLIDAVPSNGRRMEKCRRTI